MSRLPNVEIALAKKDDHFKRAKILSEEHLIILASDKGRFADDEFLIFHHELQLRQALKTNPDIDVEYAREKMDEYAENLISIIMTKDLAAFHVAACQLPEYKDRMAIHLEEHRRFSHNSNRNLTAIRKLAKRI